MVRYAGQCISLPAPTRTHWPFLPHPYGWFEKEQAEIVRERRRIGSPAAIPCHGYVPTQWGLDADGRYAGHGMLPCVSACANEREMPARIVVDPHIHCGKPCVAGTRIPVLHVLELVHAGMSFDDIMRDFYPDLQVADIQACIRYAMDVIGAEDIHITART